MEAIVLLVLVFWIGSYAAITFIAMCYQRRLSLTAIKSYHENSITRPEVGRWRLYSHQAAKLIESCVTVTVAGVTPAGPLNCLTNDTR